MCSKQYLKSFLCLHIVVLGFVVHFTITPFLDIGKLSNITIQREVLNRSSTSVEVPITRKPNTTSQFPDDEIILWELPIKTINKKAIHGGIMNYVEDYKNPCWFEINKTVGGLRCLPYFYLLGVAKCGTTSLYKQLVKHPDIVEAADKELFFWHTPFKRDSFESYLKNFQMATPIIYQSTANISGIIRHNKVTFDGTPVYFTHQGQLSSIPGNRIMSEPKYTLAHTLYRLNPKTKLIVIVRNPTDRLYSHYHHFHENGFSPEDFHKHVVVGLKMMKNCLSKHSMRSCMFNATLDFAIRQDGRIMLHYSIYSPFAREWLSVFPRNQFLMVKAEEFYENATKIMQEVYGFLDLDPVSHNVYQSIHEAMEYKESILAKTSTSYHASMHPETRKILDDFFAPFNRDLAALMNDDKFLFQ